MDTPEKPSAATLKDQQRERDRLMTENLNLKLRVKYLEDLFGDMPAGLPSVWDFESIDKEHGRMLQIALGEISERDQQLLQAAAELEVKDTKLEKTREDLSRRERLFGSLKRRLELAEGRKIDEGELWATAGPDVAELEARCKAAQAEAESVLAQGARECEALEEQVQGYRSEREALEAELAEERRSSAERRKEDKAQWEEERKMSEERQSQACARVQEVQSALEEVERVLEKEKRDGERERAVLAAQVSFLQSAGLSAGTPSVARREADGLRAALAQAEEELGLLRERMVTAEERTGEATRAMRREREAMSAEMQASEREREGQRERLSGEVQRLLAEREGLMRERERLAVKASVEPALVEELERVRGERDAACKKLESTRSELGDARREVRELDEQWARAREAVSRHADEREALIVRQRAALERRWTPPPHREWDPREDRESSRRVEVERLRECNRVLILELEDTRQRLVAEKKRRASSKTTSKQHQQHNYVQLEASAIGMSSSAVREASAQPLGRGERNSAYNGVLGETPMRRELASSNHIAPKGRREAEAGRTPLGLVNRAG